MSELTTCHLHMIHVLIHKFIDINSLTRHFLVPLKSYVFLMNSLFIYIWMNSWFFMVNFDVNSLLGHLWNPQISGFLWIQRFLTFLKVESFLKSHLTDIVKKFQVLNEFGCCCCSRAIFCLTVSLSVEESCSVNICHLCLITHSGLAWHQLESSSDPSADYESSSEWPLQVAVWRLTSSSSVQ